MMDDAAEWETGGTVKLRADLQTYLTSCIDIADKLHLSAPSRELSMVRTKLDEADLWLYRERG